MTLQWTVARAGKVWLIGVTNVARHCSLQAEYTHVQNSSELIHLTRCALLQSHVACLAVNHSQL